jgi:hypothetical protein
MKYVISFLFLIIISATGYSQKILGNYYNENLVISIQKNNTDCFNLIVNNTELKVTNKGNVDIEVKFVLCVCQIIKFYIQHILFVFNQAVQNISV